MDHFAAPFAYLEDFRLNLARDGGRRVMYGGNAYEDELEPDSYAGEVADAVGELSGSGPAV